MASYQDVVLAMRPTGAWALNQASGTDFPPYVNFVHATITGIDAYQQPGPFTNALAVHLATGGKATIPIGSTNAQRAYTEVWFKRDSASAPASDLAVIYAGNSSSNGSGIFWRSSGELSVLRGGSGHTMTGIFPTPGWHLFAFGGLADGRLAVALDGQILFAQSLTTTTPSPDNTYIASASAFTVPEPVSIALPAIYPEAMDAYNVYASYLAASDPDRAMAYTPVGGTLQNWDLLNQILASVRRTYG